jgi:hypothetical protein
VLSYISAVQVYSSDISKFNTLSKFNTFTKSGGS